jgi:hypothetical protein
MASAHSRLQAKRGKGVSSRFREVLELGLRLYLTLTGLPQEAPIQHLVQAELEWCETVRKLTQAAVRIMQFKAQNTIHSVYCIDATPGRAL